MDRKLAEKICEKSDQVRTGYSGRGMFGEKTTGIVTPDPEWYKSKVKKYRCDKMGRKFIVY